MIVFTAFWIFDAQMQIEASVSLTLRRNVQITIGTAEEEPEVDVDDDEEEEDDDDDADDDDDMYTIDSYSDISSASDVSMIGLEDVHIAIQEFINSDGGGRRYSVR